jgi:hypothetical protein
VGDLGVTVDNPHVVHVFAVVEAFGLKPPHEVAEGPPKSMVDLVFLQDKTG